MGDPRTGAPLDDGGGWTGSEEGSEEGTGGSEGVGGDGSPDAEGVWSPDIEQSFQEALAIYPPCGRRKIILSDEGKMYGRNELIARYIKLRTGKTRTRKQVSSHIQVLARRKSREIQSKLKDQVSKDKAFQTMATMSSAQLISAPSLQAKLGPSGPQATELFQFWSGSSGPTWNVPDVKPFSQAPFSMSLTPPATDLPGYEPPPALSPLPPPAPSPPAWQARALGTARLQLVEFSAFVEPPDAVDSFQRHLFVHISQQCPSPGAPPLESVDVRQIYDKFPEKKGGLRELYDRGPPHAFFLVKFWADLNWGPSAEEAGNSGGAGGFYGVSSQYESRELMTLTCSSKVCSFGKQVVEKVETERAQLEGGRFVYRLLRSPMCEYLVNFLHKLRQLPERYMMNSVLENFTILQCTPYPLCCGTFEKPTKVKVSGPQRTRPKVAPDMRSSKESEDAFFLAKSRASASDRPEESSLVKTSGSSLDKNVSIETTKLSEMDSNLLVWEDGTLATWSTSAWIAQAQVSESRVAKAQAWETLALEAQARGALQFNKPSTTEYSMETTPKQESPIELNKTSKENSNVFPPWLLWSSKAEYILALMGYLVMPSGLLRFVTCWVHKGSWSFFIAYLLMLFGLGIPLLFLEMAVGQRAQQSSIDLWKTLSPWFGGLGYSMVMVCLITNTYLNVFNSWILFYMSHIFHFVVPWDRCPLQKNSSDFDPECEQATSYTYFWYRQTLKASDSIEDGGQPSFNLAMFLFLAWCLICVFMVNGIKSLGKVLCVLLQVPYFIIICFLVRTLSMGNGIGYGLNYLLILEVARISDLTMWCQAGIQVLFDIGLGFGPVISLSSHMSDFNNCLKDAFLMGLFKIVTLLITTPFFLSILGFWATITTHHCCKK